MVSRKLVIIDCIQGCSIKALNFMYNILSFNLEELIASTCKYLIIVRFCNLNRREAIRYNVSGFFHF